METLGLGSPTQKEDNIFQRLFWPTIHNQYDVDLLGSQGFWISTAVGLFGCAGLMLTGHIAIGLLYGFVFFAGACGVRQRSIAASILIFVLYLLNVVSGLVLMPGRAGNPVVMLVSLMLLLANVRATAMSATWSSAEAGDHELPERATSSMLDKLANQLPEVLWPKLRHAFIALAAVMIALTVAGIVVGHRQGARQTKLSVEGRTEPQR